MDKAAIYCRLSKEDQDKMNQGDDSASIQNQKLLLVDYAIAHQFIIHDIYSDDDYSGLDSDRPAFNRLINDAKEGCFQVIICKTQSRFTREMELVEKYLHGLFPVIGIRFIGVIDHVDTDIKGNKKARQINGLINEWYCEDLSENIRSVFRSKMEKGQFLGSYAAYGYKKSPEDNHRLIIDEEAAWVVRKIYHYALKGLGNKQICDKLYEEDIPTPSVYKRMQGITDKETFKASAYSNKNIWGTSTIQKILSNRIYTGDMVQGKERKVSYKSKKVIAVPESEWVIVPDCHEAIIDKESFALVQELRKSRRYACSADEAGKKQINLLAGKIKCMDCGSTMVRCNGDKRYVTLYCQLYKRSKKEQCSAHSVNYNKLVEAVKLKIQDILQTNLQHINLEEYLVTESSSASGNKLLKEKEKKFTVLEDKLSRIKKALALLYLDKADNKISEEEYRELKSNLIQITEELEGKVKEADFQIQKQERKNDTYINREVILNDLLNLKESDQEIYHEFIDYIEIGEKGRDKNQEIIIHWRL